MRRNFEIAQIDKLRRLYSIYECNNYVDGTARTCMQWRAIDRETIMPTCDAAEYRGMTRTAER